MKKIVLIQPKSPGTFWKLNGLLDIIKKKAVIPPLGLATVAALTPPRYEVEIVDEDIEQINFDIKCDMIGITGYTLHSKRIFEIATEFRKRGVLTVGGGPFCTSHIEECKPHFDVLVCGEVEHIWSQFLSDWDNNEYQDLYHEKEMIDMSISPTPRWDLVKLKHYSGALVQTSRGCPYDCEFCDVVSLFGRKSRYKPFEHIMNEIKTLIKLDRFDILLADDNFIGNKKFVKQLLNNLIELNKTLKRPIRYITQLTLNVAQDFELLDLFKKANFFCFFIGIETPKKESLIGINKSHNAKLDMKEAIRQIQSRGIFIVSGMIVGFDSDDLDIFKMQSDFLIEAGLTIASLGMLIAPKGTKLWNRLEKEGRLITDVNDGDIFANTNIIPKLMNKEELEENYIQLFKEVYSYSHFLKAFKSLIDQIDVKELKKNSPLAEQMKISNTRFYYLGVTFRLIKHFLFHPEKERRQFFIAVLKTALKKGFICFPWVIELLLYFKAENEFVNQQASNSLLKRGNYNENQKNGSPRRVVSQR